MSRLIDADELYERTAEWEAQAEAYIENLNRTPLDEMTEDEKSEWRRWTAIMGERTAFKHDVADAPTIEAEPTKHGRWTGINRNRYNDDEATCSICGATFASGYSDPSWWDYCPNCGAKMDLDEVEE